MLVIALVTGVVHLARPAPDRSAAEVWTFAQSHADVYRSLSPELGEAGPLAVRLIPNNALNVRLVSLLMADRRGDELPDVVEIRQDAIGRYLAPPAEHVGLLPLDAFLDRPSTGGSARSRLIARRLLPCTRDGQVFGIPRDVHPVTLCYRADLFAEAGVDLESPTPGLDHIAWPDFQRRCLRFQAYWKTRGISDRWALDLFSANADVLAALLLQRGVNLIDTDGRVRLTDSIVAETLRFYAGLVAGPDRISTDSVSGGRNVWAKDLEAGVVCAIVTPDWRTTDLKSAAPSLAGRWRMTRLPKFAVNDAPTTTWGGTMIAIPRHCRDPEKSWKIVESLYLSDAAMAAQVRTLGILPASASFGPEALAAIQSADPCIAGSPPLRLYAELAPAIPAQTLTPDSPYATAALGYVLSQTIAAIRSGGVDDAALAANVVEWLALRQADVERQMEHGRLAINGK